MTAIASVTAPIDKRAAKILHSTYWSPLGWKPLPDQAAAPADFVYAKSMGLMFDPVAMDHDQTVAAVRSLVASLDRRTVADAFLASLSTRRLDWRSVLGSYAVFQHLPTHDHQGGRGWCHVCNFFQGEETHDLNVLNFERMKWGGVRHLSPVYAAMDMDLFLRSPAPPPTREDIAIFWSMLDAIRSADASTTSARLHALFSKSLKGNKSERDIIISILGFSDVLTDGVHPGFSDAFIPVTRRADPNRHNVDMAYPACWWTAREGIDELRLHDYFGHVL